MKSLLFVFSLAFLPFLLYAQVNEFSFISDWQFTAPNKLYGYTFVPAQGKLLKAHYPSAVEKGLVRFEITANDIRITEQIKFTVSGIEKISKERRPKRLSLNGITEIVGSSGSFQGYQIAFRDVSNPDITGHLKVFLNKHNQATELHYRANSSDPEKVYYLKEAPKEILASYDNFFSHSKDFPVKGLADLIDKEIYPFIRLIENFEYKQFNRVYEQDSLSMRFEQRTVMKGKKEKSYDYFILKRPDDAGKITERELLIKKVKELDLNPNDSSKELELSLKDETTNENFLIYISITSQNTLRALHFDNEHFILRRQKHVEK